MTWLWILIGVLGLVTVGQGLLMVVWSVLEIVRQLLFGTGVDG